LVVIQEIDKADIPDGMKRRYLKLILKRHGRLLRSNGQ